MRTSEIDMLILPGASGTGPDHWQSRWARHFKTARWIEPARGDTLRQGWVEQIVAAVMAPGERPAVIVAHGLAVAAVAHAAPRLAGTRLAGAFLVAPVDVDAGASSRTADGGLAPLPAGPLPFPSKMIGSSTDPACTTERCQEIGRAWGSDVSIIANGGHIDVASGHGAWPEGLLTFGLFLRSLG
jgi:predicted alpha/beta hydrolase family esterase